MPPGWASGVQLGLRQTQALIRTKTMRRGRMQHVTLVFSSKLLLSSNIDDCTLPLLIVSVWISACVCRRPSWTPKAQPGGISAVTWLSFWCPTRLDIPKKVNGTVRTMPFIFVCVIYPSAVEFETWVKLKVTVVALDRWCVWCNQLIFRVWLFFITSS